LIVERRANEVESYRVTDLGTMALRTVEQRDFEAHNIDH
jgi:hypothetical protein